MTAFRHWLRWVWACLLLTTGAIRRARRRLTERGAIIVLALHRVLDDADYQRTDSLTGMILRRRTFEQLAAYAVRQFEIVDVLYNHPGKKSRLPRCAFTFDDGWCDNYSSVLAVASDYGIPLTVFLCPGLMGRTKPFWPERIAGAIKAARPATQEREIERFIERLKTCAPDIREQAIAKLGAADNSGSDADEPDRTLSWTQVLNMDLAGVRFGSHTQTHQVLTAVPEAVARWEILESKDCLQKALNKPCNLFAYPNGNYSAETRRLVADSEFSLAFTTQKGAWTAVSDPLAIPRTNLSESDVTGPTGRFSPALFQYTACWKTWRAMRAADGANDSALRF